MNDLERQKAIRACKDALSTHKLRLSNTKVSLKYEKDPDKIKVLEHNINTYKECIEIREDELGRLKG